MIFGLDLGNWMGTGGAREISLLIRPSFPSIPAASSVAEATGNATALRQPKRGGGNSRGSLPLPVPLPGRSPFFPGPLRFKSYFTVALPSPVTMRNIFPGTRFAHDHSSAG